MRARRYDEAASKPRTLAWENRPSTSMSSRRIFLTGGAASLCTALAAWAEIPDRIVRIGWLGAGSPAPNQGIVDAFRRGMREYGWNEPQNLSIEFRWAEGRTEQLAALAIELVRMKVDVIVAPNEAQVPSAMRATTTIPIVMANAADPVRLRFVNSLAHPGGNVTGLTMFAPDLGAKRLQLLKDMVPNLARVAILWNGDNPGKTQEAQETRLAAKHYGLSLSAFELKGSTPDLEREFHSMALQAQAVVVLGDSLLFGRRHDVQSLAAQYRLPAIYETRAFLDAGGLVSYGPDVLDMFRRAAYYVDRILKGAKPADLPIEQPAKIELVINRTTARALDLTIPQSLLLRADELLE
jgi:putative ABC transport system substrate-binding protein